MCIPFSSPPPWSSGCSFSWAKEGHLLIRVLWPASAAGKRVLPKYVISQIPSAEMFNMPRCWILGVVCPEPHQWEEWSDFSESKPTMASESQPPAPSPLSPSSPCHSTGSSFLVLYFVFPASRMNTFPDCLASLEINVYAGCVLGWQSPFKL